jgi:hypothetical protein
MSSACKSSVFSCLEAYASLWSEAINASTDVILDEKFID